MTKIGRNEPCTCGSGKEFKHCHGRLGDDGEMIRRRRIIEDRFAAADHQRRQQQGHGLPIRFFRQPDGMVVIVGQQWFKGQWQTFHTFLFDYLAETMVREWWVTEIAKSAGSRHPAAEWATVMRDTWQEDGDLRAHTANNATRAILALAYNIYLIEHHYQQYDQPLLKRLVKRLRDPLTFFPTLAETYAAASFLEAGFHLHYEDERKGGHHPEFIATHPGTGKKFSVEVKCRSGDDRPEADTAARLRIRDKIFKALKKDVLWSRVIFVDVNIPDIAKPDNGGWLNDVVEAIETAEHDLRIKGNLAPPAYLFIMNHPFHFNPTSMEGPPVIGALGFRIPDFNARGVVTFREVILGRKKHIEMMDLLHSLRVHAEPPATFDGQAPELAFSNERERPLLIGNRYLVPGPDGADVEAELETATMLDSDKKAYGIFATAEGRRFIVTCPMTDAEIAAYRRHPKTFFGTLQHVGGEIKSAFELADFMYETYQHTPKAKLLEFMEGHPQIEQFRKLTQEDLAILYCEMCAARMESQKRSKGL